MDRKNIFIVGLDAFHERMAKRVSHADEYAFHSLLDYDEVIAPESYSIGEMLVDAERQLKEFGGPVDAVVAHWDFPVSTMLPILARKFDLHAASLDAVLKCEHKYWSRLEQRQVMPEMTPRFAAVDPFDDGALDRIDIDYPFWIKPVKAFASHLGFRIDGPEEFARAMRITREKIRRLGDPFNVILSHADLPAEILEVDGNHCIAEEIMSGKQCGLEGYVLDGEVHVVTVVDCVKDSDKLSFQRYEIPSVWPEEIQQRMIDATRRLMAHMGFDNSPFGIEFFWDERTDRLGVLEVNTRISQSHSDQYIKLFGVSNHEMAIQTALDREPSFDPANGVYKTAAKFMLRKYDTERTRVERVPREEELRELANEFPHTIIKPVVEEGQLLDDIRDQDSYSAEVCHIFLGADSQEELLRRYHAIAEALDFRFSDGEGPEKRQFVDVSY